MCRFSCAGGRCVSCVVADVSHVQVVSCADVHVQVADVSHVLWQMFLTYSLVQIVCAVVITVSCADFHRQ